MDILIRKMKPEESLAVWKLGIVTFHSMEGIFMGKPKQAVVAVKGEKSLEVLRIRLTSARKNCLVMSIMHLWINMFTDRELVRNFILRQSGS